ncbi:MAG: translocation protein TolB [Bdellovibrionia bacterium]
MKHIAIVSILFSALSISWAHGAYAGDTPYIAVGKAKAEKAVIAMPEIRTGGNRELATLGKEISDTVTNDLNFMDMFKFLGSSAFVEDTSKAGITLDQFKLSDWTSIGAKLLIKSQLSSQNGNLVLESYLYDTYGARQLLGKRFVALRSDVKTLAHSLANSVVEALTQQPGIFLTKIAMSCERNHRKEIYMMNFDGSDVKQVTQHHSIAFAPAWNPDGNKLAYSVYAKHRGNIKNIDLFEFDFRTSTYKVISNRKGINSGAAYNPDRSGHIALTMSFLGNPEIFVFNPGADTVTRLTKSFGFDVDPVYSPDGKSLAFVSSRSGQPMIYRMNADGSNVKRLTYAGHYNATPTWSPMNNKIGFAGDIDGHFDIFIMNPDGTNIERLTKGQGNNEDPNFSPDGNFLVFSSNRTGQANIYVMNVDGTYVKRLTYGLGNCSSPKWSLPPK